MGKMSLIKLILKQCKQTDYENADFSHLTRESYSGSCERCIEHSSHNRRPEIP